MAGSELGAWKPLGVERIVEIFGSASFRWWIAGGHALDLHLARNWRDHDDIDVGVVRADLDAVYTHLSDWDLHVAAAGRLRPWVGEPLEALANENNVWCRAASDRPWMLDLTIGDGTDQHWIYRRDPSFVLPWTLAVLHTAEGVPYLAPDLQLLFKSKDPRPKDNVDAEEVIPTLDAGQRERLSRQLDAGHSWARLLG